MVSLSSLDDDEDLDLELDFDDDLELFLLDFEEELLDLEPAPLTLKLPEPLANAEPWAKVVPRLLPLGILPYLKIASL